MSRQDIPRIVPVGKDTRIVIGGATFRADEHLTFTTGGRFKGRGFTEKVYYGLRIHQPMKTTGILVADKVSVPKRAPYFNKQAGELPAGSVLLCKSNGGRDIWYGLTPDQQLAVNLQRIFTDSAGGIDQAKPQISVMHDLDTQKYFLDRYVQWTGKTLPDAHRRDIESQKNQKPKVCRVDAIPLVIPVYG